MVELLQLADEVAAALAARGAVVALESTLIAHGLPWPKNLETALEAEAAVREAGAIPATIAVLEGAVRVGLRREELESLARSTKAQKASRRDLAAAIVQKRTAATTVAATMFVAHRAGIRFFATGGIGGVHRGSADSFDVSADLAELARTPVAVVCAGAKSLLDLPKTLELLETLGVPVVGYRTDAFPAFYSAESGLSLGTRGEEARELAALAEAHFALGGAGLLIVQPPPAADALPIAEVERWIEAAHQDAARDAVRGPEVTPFVLRRLAELSGGRTLRTNQTLIVANARLAGEVAAAGSRTSDA